MSAPTRAIAGLMPVTAQGEPTTTKLKINKLEEIHILHASNSFLRTLPQSAQRCRELAFLSARPNRNRTAWLIMDTPQLETNWSHRLCNTNRHSSNYVFENIYELWMACSQINQHCLSNQISVYTKYGWNYGQESLPTKQNRYGYCVDCLDCIFSDTRRLAC